LTFHFEYEFLQLIIIYYGISVLITSQNGCNEILQDSTLEILL
jgi:hypothetical protein